MRSGREGAAGLITRMREFASKTVRPFGDPARYVLFLSLTAGHDRAVTVSACAESFDAAWAECANKAAQRCPGARWLRLDWVEEAAEMTMAELRSTLERTKRNYFRCGISLDGAFRHAFLETELNANAMLYGGNAIVHAVLNERNFARYARLRHGLSEVDFSPARAVWVFRTGGLFLADEDAAPVELHGTGRNAGRRRVEVLGVADLDGLIAAGSRYLARQVSSDGRFAYGWHPCFDRPIRTYNSLRHASTLYAMLEAFEVTRDPVLGEAIERAATYLCERLIRPVEAAGKAMAFLVETNGEIKLGGNGVCLLALVKYAEVFGTERHRDLLDHLGEGILHMQHAEDGSFDHVLRYPSLEVSEPFRIIYYEGEAAFGLVRLYGLTCEPRWLAAVELAFRHFIRKGHWKAHDHWLGYCVNELTFYRPSEGYFRFGLRNFRSYLDFVLERITTFPTLLELMTSAEQLLARIEASPRHRHLLGEVDRDSFYEALHFRAHYLLNGHFWPELAMFYARPDKIVGSFFIRHHAFRVRIDDVEHYLSGLIAYRRFLLERGERHPADPERVEWRERNETGWNARNLPLATGGVWRVRPPERWRSTGVFIHPEGFLPGRVAAVRLQGVEKGVAPGALVKGAIRPAAILASDPAQVPLDVPKLWVESPERAVMDMARYARARFTGKVVAVTGSAGKTTTVAMTAHALRPFGLVGQTAHNANLPLGVAWNLASMRWSDPHIVLELSIGRMAQSAELARPDVAIFTNVLAAHLVHHKSTAQIARLKSRIFLGMGPDSVAVLNREMLEWDIVHAAATARHLRVIPYGTSPDCDVQLVGYDQASGAVKARIFGERVAYRLGAPGKHMALNSVGVLAAVAALGRDLGLAAAQLESFELLSGRGKRSTATFEGKAIEVWDDAYNANPASMRAALRTMQASSSVPESSRVLVLGDMLELGPGEQAMHLDIVEDILAARADRVLLCGPLMQAVAERVLDRTDGCWFPDAAALLADLGRWVREGDVILVKASHGTQLGKVVNALLRDSRE